MNILFVFIVYILIMEMYKLIFIENVKLILKVFFFIIDNKLYFLENNNNNNLKIFSFVYQFILTI